MADEDDNFLNTDDVVADVSIDKNKKGADPLLFEVEGDVQSEPFNLDEVLKVVDKINLGSENKPRANSKPEVTAQTAHNVAKKTISKRSAREAPSSAEVERKPVRTQAVIPPVSLDIRDGLEGLSGMAGLVIQISGLPNGASLNNGYQVAQGCWELSFSDTTNLSVIPPQSDQSPFELTVTALQGEAVLLTGVVEIVPEPPSVSVEDPSGSMGGAWDWSSLLNGDDPDILLFDESLPQTFELSSGSKISFKTIKPIKW